MSSPSEFNTKLILRPNFRAVMSQPGSLELNANVAALRNGGTSTVLINGGAWSLLPGESLHFGSQTDVNVVKVDNWNIAFDTALGSVNRLQILEIKTSPCN